MGRSEVGALKRDSKVGLTVDDQLHADLQEIADGWKVPLATACYWMLKGQVAGLRGEKVVMVGDQISERAARWMVARMGES